MSKKTPMVRPNLTYAKYAIFKPSTIYEVSVSELSLGAAPFGKVENFVNLRTNAV